MDDIWFQQEICHTARKTIQLLYESFPGRNFPFLIRIGRIVQFFFGFLKFKIYTITSHYTDDHLYLEEEN